MDGSEETMWNPSLWIISSGEGKVIGITGGVSDGELGITVSGSGGQDSHRRRRLW